MELAREPEPEPDEISTSIIAAARAEFEQYGIRRANVEQVARRAGVSRGTLYRRFPSERDLVRAVVSHDVAAFTAQFDAAWNVNEPIEDRLAAVLALTVDSVRA